MTETKNEITLLENLPTAIEIFAAGAADDFVAKVKAEVDAFERDISTEKGRTAMRSFWRKIGSAKLRVDELGQQLTEEEKKKIDAVNAERKRVKAIFEKMQDDFIKPLDEFTEKEKTRIATHENNVAKIEALMTLEYEPAAAELQDRINKLDMLDDGYDWQEFAERAKVAKLKAKDFLLRKHAETVKCEAEQAELAEHRRQQAEREQKERDERIAAEAAEKARKDAEEKAAREKQEADRLQRETEERAEKERLAREQADRDRKAAEDLAAAQAKEQAERHARELKEAADKAEREKQAAIEAERQRVEEQKRLDAEAAEKREQDLAHKKKINNLALDAIKEVLDAFKETGNDPAQALVEAIARGKIPNVKINY